jgi:predicted nucleotidyltransferase component of viral defense system
LSDDLTLAELLEAQAYFGLPSPALVEKDFQVVRALAVLAALDTGPVRLVFGGGTALSRAHKLIRRMSEDIDFKIVAEGEISRGTLRTLRAQVTDALRAAGFAFDPDNPEHRLSRNETRYTLYRLPYAPLSRGEGALRPEIKVELAAWPLRRPSEQRTVASFVAEAFTRAPEVPGIACVAIAETAAEKFVALTRRVAAAARGGEAWDSTVIRHVYDLHMARGAYDASEAARLVRDIMPQDAAMFGNQFPDYRENPEAATRAALSALLAGGEFAAQYEQFCDFMVYGDRVDYATAMDTVAALAAAVWREG